MRILVVADSHGKKDNLKVALESVEYDKLIFVGDGIKDILEMPDLDRDKLIMVKGNNDDTKIIPENELVEIENKKIFITHGHQYNVKFGLKNLIETALKQQADVIIYAHTHIPVQMKLDNGLICINPGSVGKGKLSQNTFAVIDIDAKQDIFNCNICQII